MEDQKQKASPDFIASEKKVMLEWEAELERFQSLRPIQGAIDQIRLKELPGLEEQIKKQEGIYPEIGRKVEEVSVLFTSGLT